MPELMNKPIGGIGYGLMGLTWRPPHLLVDQATAFAAMRQSLSQGANFWNGGELYGTPERNSCHLLYEYFHKYPEDAEKVILSIKGGTLKGGLHPDGSEANIRRSVEDCLADLKGCKKIDIFECARVDPNISVEETTGYLAKLVEEGKIGGIGLSEVKASTIDRAVKIHPIAAVEVELSLWSPDILKNGVAETCAKHSIPIVAYSPLMRGALAEHFRKNSEIPDGDFRRMLPKFQDDVLEHNNKITDEVDKIAQKKGYTKAQVAIAWVRQLSNTTIQMEQRDGTVKDVKLGVIVPIPGATMAERVKENSTQIELSEEEMKKLNEVVRDHATLGERYPEFVKHLAEG